MRLWRQRIRAAIEPLDGSDGKLGAPPIPPRELLRRILRLLKPQRYWLAVITVGLTLAVVLSTVSPLFSRALIDNAMFCKRGCPKPPLMFGLVGAMVTAMIASSILGVSSAYFNNRVGQSVVRDIRARLYSQLTRQSMRFFSEVRTGDLQVRLLNDVDGINGVVTEAWPNAYQNAMTVTTTVAAMVFMSWPLALVSIGMVIPLMIPGRYAGRISRRIALSTQRTSADMVNLAEETLSISGAMLAKVFGRQEALQQKFQEHNDRLSSLMLRNEVINRAITQGLNVFWGLAPFGVYVTAALLLSLHAPMTAGTIIAFLALQTRLNTGVQGIFNLGVTLSTSFAYFERIYEYLDLTPDIEDLPQAISVNKADVVGTVEFCDVSFSYIESQPTGSPLPSKPVGESSRHWALEGVNLRIAAGQTAAIVGPSGAGKTSLSYLVARLYDVNRGSVEIDGHDVRNLRLSSLSEIIGVATQDAYILQGTIRENLAYARPDASEDQFLAATTAASLHERICQLPEGYESLVGAGGYRLSGGERQRLALARVLLKDPPILILDEATSSLDTISERAIQHALIQIMADRTTLVIAHRLSTIVNADVIFVMDRGRLVDQGTHEELLAHPGLYADLYSGYFRDGSVEAHCADGLVLSSGEVTP